ncbi:hypothetical protein [Sulfurirhabdus autotrophica]|uniref:Uncharacterized protein n=1 Tax=Sulfurirhabdus autotrophica TaxID=1706046 RepID=A0A4R3XRW4_9PROT|nr:hypothetical protein [Sulfurirhabdus autotrophica]TCV77551.1 hypothetical protein EDC63_1481 [Sulfurirhabdus autotrophica]
MKQIIEFGSRVKLITFHGTEVSLEPVAPEENFWQLVGGQGVVVSEKFKAHSAFPDKGKRALVKFDHSLDELGLLNHNETPNSIWIFISDLKPV